MNGPAPRGIAAALSLSLALVSPLGARRQDPPLFRAAGQPIFDCAGMRDTATRLRAGLPVQDEWIRRTEDQLKAAREGVTQSKEALRELAIKHARDLAAHQLKLVKEIEDKIAKAAARRPSEVVRRQWVSRVLKLKEGAEAVENLVASGQAGFELGQAINSNQATLVEFIKQVGESGISDELGIKAAEFAGPAGVLAVEGFAAARDTFFAIYEGHMNLQELEIAERNLMEMRAARSAVESRAYELEGIVASSDCTPPTTPQPQQSPMPTPPPGARPVDTPPPAAPAPAKPKASMGKRLGITLGVAGAVAGAGGYLATHSSSLSGSHTGSSGGTPTLKSFTQFICQGNECRGDVTINFPMVITSGSIIVGTDPSFFAGQKIVSSTSVAGDQTITLTHNYSLTCYGTQTGMGIWNATSTNGPTSWSIKATIPVTCR